jgi:ribosome-binding factor A
MATVKRATRVAGRMQEELSRALRELGDPRLEGVLVSRVELTDDLQTCRVYVRREQGFDDKAVKAALKGLGAASSRLRKMSGQAMGLRTTPELRFFYDTSLDDVNRIEELLREVKATGPAKTGP